MRTVDEARLVAREKQRGACDLLRLANAALLNRKSGIRHIDTKLVELVDLAQPCGVRTNPGQTALQRMFWSRYSTAIERANMWQAPFDVL